ncbi:hypothetical protein C7S20_02150 [Christiangramia fulva]|uniref:BT-2262-like C-terminal domain-containing protein n=1 Tax=Christiangramia fulva TaxID=2126553 RepID=A0A2R3Z1M3_9FLAO|nr:BT_2262 family domain-containing protein [Christiangramia fulva]AVR44161.1 hypothetical protein C7S20_02150 [Christiangramia fulva]
MKNYRILFYTFAILGLFLTSCNTDDEPLVASSVTYLPKITLEGSTKITLPCDTESYTDPGAIAEAGGQEIELTTSISGTYFGGNTIDGPDIYSVAYSAFNEDGIPATAFRSVYWPPCNGDLVNSITGVYEADVVRNGSTSPQYQDLGPIMIIDLGNGVYQLSDAIGGYYDYGRGYGPAYAATGMTVTANNIATNDFTLDDTTGVGAFGGTLEMDSFTVNPAAGTIKFKTSWDAGYVFEVTLTQVQQ